ncbi:MAG: redoxin domain-containing protein [Chlorobi bacterium]|nr:redoxin domain-containing protein [Chlorobiota bacterium]
MKQKSLWAMLLFLGFSVGIKAQGYEIKIIFHHLQDTSVYLGYHFGDKKFVKDTLHLDRYGMGVFRGDETLPGGVYLLVMPNMRYLEFLVDDNQHFTIETDTTDFLKTLHFKGSQTNTDFLAYQSKLVELNRKLQELNRKERTLKSQPDSLKAVRNRIEEINQKTRALNEQVIASHPGSFLAHLVSAMTPPIVPDFEIPENSANPDSVRWVMNYQYLRNHYFDDVDFSDDRLLRSPILYNRLTQYFNNILLQTPDSLIPEVDRIIEASRANKDVYQYVVITLLNHFQRATVMGLDEVYVHIAVKYYLTGQTPWSDSTFLAELKQRVEKIKPNLIGHKAHDLKMETITGEWVDLYEVNAKYIILYFWEPNCGHCKKVTPILYKDIYLKYRDKGLEVFTVYIYDNHKEWEDYLNEHGYDWINAWDPKQLTYFRYYYDVYSTPTIYVLDRDKKIIAKRLDIKTLEKFLARLFGE